MAKTKVGKLIRKVGNWAEEQYNNWNDYHDNRQIKQQGRLNELNMKASKELADYENELKMKMWNDTNYSAQMEHARKAGVSKAALFGGGAGGGVAQGAGVSGVNGGGAASGTDRQRVANEQLMMMAQIKNLNADTEKKKAEADVTGGVGKEKLGVEVENLKLDGKWKEIDVKVKGATAEDAIDLVRGEYLKQTEELAHLKNTTGINLNTYEDQIKEVRARAAGAILGNHAITKGMEVDDATISKMKNDVAIGWGKLALDSKTVDQNDERIKIDKFNAEMRAKYPSMWNVVGKAMVDTFRGIGSPGYETNMK